MLMYLRIKTSAPMIHSIRLIISFCLFLISAFLIISNNQTEEIVLCVVISMMLALVSGFGFYYLLIKSKMKILPLHVELSIIILPAFIGVSLFLLGIDTPKTILPNFTLFLASTLSMTGIARMEYEKFYPR